ncbi:AIPR family protein [Clostridium sp. CF012]|uniref:AIPR family protein n=1 Tax=Clostridium sp. CF012 TaxID=2843319 RepID=UPI001C0B06AD|nr:AIPR family protein [Clostridium sp. CF012]MBU3144637.1 AIPR family protein [Clostridium sp. CF012]
MSKYSTLVNILDELRNEAPKGYKRYYPSVNEKEKLDAARSRAFVHLFLKVYYGLSDFFSREDYITDDPADGGIDAYYIDSERKLITFVQSKFRTNEVNFENKRIDLDEILKMDVDRITDGYNTDEDGNTYNDKIINMMKRISGIPDVGRYRYEVIILANLKSYKDSVLKRLTGGFSATVFDYDKCYTSLLFPIVTGCYFNADEINIALSLINKESNEGRISYSVQTEFSDCKIMVVFVPLIEIAKIVYKYKNSILKFNPRCYLGLNNNDVNPKIENTIRNKKTNEFALFNNGITILSDNTELNSKIALKDSAQLIITNPQIINGGQTAYTLATVYEKCLKDKNEYIFDNKEVLVKVITFFEAEGNAEGNQQKKLSLIEELSRATNEQSAVRESDRRSNDKAQINYQAKIFNEFGYFYNRKRGEFHDGLSKKYIEKDKIIDHSVFIRVAVSAKGDVARARRNSEEFLFRESNFKEVFVDSEIYKKYMFGYFCHQYLVELEKIFDKTQNNKYGVNTYGNALRYGKYAIVNVVTRFFDESFEISIYKDLAKNITDKVLNQWLGFEKAVSEKSYNNDYFYSYMDDNKKNIFYNFDGYYKGRNIDNDIKGYKFNIESNDEEVAATLDE